MKNLRLAIQKSGRLNKGSVDLLAACGIDFGNGLGKLRSKALNFPIEILLLRDDDIPSYVEDGVADLGIVGENVLYEKASEVEVVTKLGFGNCRLAIATPKTSNYDSISTLDKSKIATSYPILLRNFLNQKGIDAEIHEISGSVEIAPSIGLADAVCDLVSSGSTLFSNGLREIETILDSEAVLICRSGLEPELKESFERLTFRVEAQKSAKQNKYILLNAPKEKLEEIVDLLPGMRSPSVLPLNESNWCSVHSVVPADDYWETVERLKSIGAEGILVLSIDQMVS